MPFSAVAQEIYPRFLQLTIDDEPSQNSVHSILQDCRGIHGTDARFMEEGVLKTLVFDNLARTFGLRSRWESNVLHLCFGLEAFEKTNEKK